MDKELKSMISKIASPIIEEDAPLSPPTDIDWGIRTQCIPGQYITAMIYIPNNPQIIIDTAINDPDKIRRGDLPMGVIKILGTFPSHEEAKAYASVMIKDNKFRAVSTRPTGDWHPIVSIHVLEDRSKTEMIDANGRSILLAEKMRIMSEEANNKRDAAKRLEISEMYSKRMDDESDIMWYIKLKYRKNYAGNIYNQSKEKLLQSASVLENTIKSLEELESKYPEYKENWREALNQYCKDTGENNPYNDKLADVINSINRTTIKDDINSIISK